MTTLTQSTPRLNDDEIARFQRDGYLAFPDILNAGEVTRSREALARTASEMAGDPSSIYSPPRSNLGNYSGASYKRADSRSMIQLEPEFDPTGQSPQEIESMVRKYMSFCGEDPVFGEMTSPGSRLHEIVESLIGPAPIFFQDMALVKPALVGVEKPWHQDNAYFSVEPLDAIVGVWIALDDAAPENGCMHVIPGGHKQGGFKHHHGTDCEIDALYLDLGRVIPVPVAAGGAMFFYGMLPHRTPPNRSRQRRRALQFHFRAADSRIVDDDAYNRIFVDRSGSPASCRVADSKF